jgi:hypothetical protein
MKSLVVVVLLSTLCAKAVAQGIPASDAVDPGRSVSLSAPPEARLDNFVRYRIQGKTVSQYAPRDWGEWIDSTWGAGQGATAQLQIFDSFWNWIDQQWAGFPNLSVNWDSLRTVYRSRIGSGLSRGRFFALMSQMAMHLQEHHTWIVDHKVEDSFGYNTFHYKSGVPLLNIGTGWEDPLGAPITALPDSTGLVYRVAPGNPLGLEPGDVILGYNGVRWKMLSEQLLDIGVPVSRWWATPGSTPESRIYNILSAVGWNWGMFDTIEVVKYSTGDTIHLPTAPLNSLSQTVWASDQVPLAGVQMPQGVWGSAPAVSWGVVQGTNIGYIYTWDWWDARTSQLFQSAVSELLKKRVEGLVMDFRMNWGGDPSNANAGLSQLFNVDPTGNLSVAKRSSVSNHMAFSNSGTIWGFAPSDHPFDRPIAVLIGPACRSAGDWNAFRMRFHPMARSFGKATDGAFVGGDWKSGTMSDAWEYQLPTSIARSNIMGEGYMIHKGVQPDEEIWLTRAGVAKGEDDVVKRALQWINTLSYAHDVQLLQLSKDTVVVKGRVANPLSHTINVIVTLRDGARVIMDSVTLAGDSVWSHQYVPSADAIIHASVCTEDITAGTSRTLNDVAQFVFSRGASISMDTHDDNLGTICHDLSHRDTVFAVRNTGFATDSLTVALDPGNVVPDTAVLVSPKVFTLAAGDSQMVAFRILPGLLPSQYYAAQATVQSWRSFNNPVFVKNLTFRVDLCGSVSDPSEIPTEFALEQNYPNPFNPTTVVSCQLPVASNLRLVVYDMLGREVAVLMDERKGPGRYEVIWDARRCASGVYICRMVAGAYVASRKTILTK